MTDKIHIRWEEFHQDVKTVCKKIKSSGTYNKIVAISRGGLLPAGIIAYELDIRNCHSLNIATYIGGEHRQLERLENLEDAGTVDEKTLIVDDLSDSGQTFHLLRKEFPQARYVSIYSKPAGLMRLIFMPGNSLTNGLFFPGIFKTQGMVSGGQRRTAGARHRHGLSEKSATDVRVP